MTLDGRAFTVRETHGILLRPDHEIWKSSDSLGWTTAYASVQREAPYEDSFKAIDAHLTILHLDGPVRVRRRFDGGETARVIPPGGIFMMPGGMNFGVGLGAGLQTIHLYLRHSLIQEVAADLLTGDPARLELLPRFGDTDPLIENLLLAVREVLEGGDAAATIPYVDYLLRALAAHLIRKHSSASAAGPVEAMAKLGRRHLERAVDFMRTHIDRSITLIDIADAANLSPSHFARQFRATLGMAPHQYLVQLRIEQAKRLLAETEMPVAEIAFACGFANQEHLTRLFKRSSGTTPAAYRKCRRG